MRQPAATALALLAGLGVGPGCAGLKEQPPPPFEVAIRVESDPGHPLPGAVIMKGGKEGPSTGPDGRVPVKIMGLEGESVDLTVKCPPDYISPVKPINVILRRIAGTKLVEYDVRCPPTLRRMVVAVRADNGPNLPVMYLGRELTRTDPTGAATLLFQLRPGEQFELAFDTTEKTNERIRPQNPTQNFVMRADDDIVTMDQRFTWLAKPTHYVAPPMHAVEIKSRHPHYQGF
jgi:hypothetical protein